MAKQKQGSETMRADEATETRHQLRVAETPEPAEEEQDEAEPEQYSHWGASHKIVTEAMRDGSDCVLSELAHDADQLVIAGGGRSNVDRCWSIIYGLLQSLEEMGMLEMSEEVSIHPIHRLPSTNGQK